MLMRCIFEYFQKKKEESSRGRGVDELLVVGNGVALVKGNARCREFRELTSRGLISDMKGISISARDSGS